MKVKTSAIWAYYEVSAEDEGFAVCNHCQSKISRGSKVIKKMTVSNLKSHLKNKHPEQYAEYAQTDDENNEKKRQHDEDDDEAEAGVGTSNLGNKKQKDDFYQKALPEVMNLNIPVWKTNDPKNEKYHKSVLNMMIWDLDPFNIVRKPGFVQLVKTFQPHFNLGSPKMYTERMAKTYDGCKEKLKGILSQTNPQDIALVLDGWSQFHHGYIGVNIHFLTESWERKVFNIGCVPSDSPHTGQAMATMTMTLLQEWNVQDKICFMVRDSAANMIRMGNLVTWDHGDCTNHTLQLCIKDEIFSMPSVETLLEKCRAICTLANSSIQFAKAIRDAQEMLEADVTKQLIQDVVTRWNSSFDMLNRFFELKEAVRTVLSDDKWRDKVDPIFNQEWELVEKVVTVLKFFKDATLMLSSSEACISQVIPIVKLITDSMAVTSNRADTGVKAFKKKLKASLDRRFNDKESIEKYTHATLLDPRYKKVFFQNPDKCQEAVKSLLVKLKEESRKDIAVIVPQAAPVDEVGDVDNTGAAATVGMSILNMMKKAQETS